MSQGTDTKTEDQKTKLTDDHKTELTKFLDIDYSKTINVSQFICNKIGSGLHLNESHPIGIIKGLVYKYFDSKDKKFEKFEDLCPVVSVESNFDQLLIPWNHPARSRSDTYYIDTNHVLRTHTSAHQNELLSQGHTSFLVTGDVYRKDEIDSTHYPVFHQMEGVKVDTMESMTDKELEDDLIKTLKGLCNHLFPESEVRVSGDYFPFTDPSFQMEVYHKGRWIEILGSGIIQGQILKNCSKQNPNLISTKSLDKGPKKGWAFGLGLDRLAMILFEIPDIRMLWVKSEKFIGQFTPNTITKFKPYSVLDTISKDVSFYIPRDQVTEFSVTDAETGNSENVVRTWRRENDMCESVRESANSVYPDIVSKVEMFDQFYNAKLSKLSRAYRISYSPPDPLISDPGEFTVIINRLHAQIAKNLGTALNVEIR